ncbi:MAG: hypothetical protein HZB47_08455 [Nitrosomonadales bacterium]|nr:hypothetical protein [Nitrosomonadales bacterium]
MKEQIVRVSPIRTAKVLAVLYFLMGLPFIGLMAITYMLATAAEPKISLLIFLPFAYLIFGVIFTAIGALAYDVVAKWVGGVEHT